VSGGGPQRASVFSQQGGKAGLKAWGIASNQIAITWSNVKGGGRACETDASLDFQGELVTPA
jgi:hypothetical protein